MDLPHRHRYHRAICSWDEKLTEDRNSCELHWKFYNSVHSILGVWGKSAVFSKEIKAIKFYLYWEIKKKTKQFTILLKYLLFNPKWFTRFCPKLINPSRTMHISPQSKCKQIFSLFITIQLHSVDIQLILVGQNVRRKEFSLEIRNFILPFFFF